MSPNKRPATAAHVAFVLHSHDWSESSLILELFTREAGRVVAAAKGAKRPTSQMRAVLMPFQRITVQFARTRGDDGSEVRTLRAAEFGGAAASIHGAAWFAGFYLNELLLRLLARDDAHPRLFDAYAAALGSLDGGEVHGGSALRAEVHEAPALRADLHEAPALRAEVRSESALRAFELLLLQETGVLPELQRTTLTQAPVQPQRRYALRPEQGLGEASHNDTSLSGACCLALAQALQSWPADADPAAGFAVLQDACKAELQPLKSQLRAQLHYHLGGAPLRTRQMMIEAQRLFDTGSTNKR
jgi:DNA repair protein RecO (recombination protein O)